MDGVHPDLVIGPSTEILAGNGKILTAGADRLPRAPHLPADPRRGARPPASPRSSAAAPDPPRAPRPPPSRPAPGTSPGCWRPSTPARSTSRCSARATRSPRERHVGAAARPAPSGFKLHEDWGTTPAAIDACLTVADATGVQVAIHTDTLNEAGFVESTRSPPSRAGRSTRTTPRARAAGTRPTSSRVASQPQRAALARPTRPGRTPSTPLDEHLDMLMVCHHLNPAVPEDLAFAESRIRPVDHRGRGRAARPGRHLDDRLRLPGHGPGRRGRSCAPGRPRT